MSDAPTPHRRRPRYSGKNPRRFEDKYKELNPEKYPETVARVRASGKTPAGMHVPIMVRDILGVLAPQPGERAIDCTLGYGGHACEILRRLQPGGQLIGLDVDPIEQPRTESRMRELGHDENAFQVRRTNFASLPKVLGDLGWSGADVILADLGISSMQIDTPSRGFSIKVPGPLDMRMNPQKGSPASHLLETLSSDDLIAILHDNADEPRAELLARRLAGRKFSFTTELADAVRDALPRAADAEKDKTIRRVFQALRIAVNDEFTVLDTFLRHLPMALNPGGRVAILTFHSGEDRRVKKAFQAALHDGLYSAISDDVIRPDAEETRSNPRSTSAKLRWARR